MPAPDSRPRSQSSPVYARNVVATSQPLAVQAGLAMLRQGGNAIDAALAAAIALTVVEPTSNGLGSDAFAIIREPDGRLHGLNGSGRSPKALDAERLRSLGRMPLYGWDAVTTPGAVDAWARLWKRFGSLPFAALFEPAIGYAEEGFLVSPLVALDWKAAAQRFGRLEGFRAAFTRDGLAPEAGELFRNPDQARSLRLIAQSEGSEFYAGSLAERIVQAARRDGGALRGDDLAEHAAEWVDPLSIPYGDLRVHELPPNGQGLAALIALGVLDRLEWDRRDPEAPEAVHFQIEAMKRAFAEAHRHIADPGAMRVAPVAFLEPDFLDRCARGVDSRRAAFPDASLVTDRGTVYLTAADASGLMVSYIQSNYLGFGSGIVIPDTGISLQNRGAGFVLEPGHPNQVAGGKRPYHTIVPAFATREGEPMMSFGVMGGHMQPQGHVQMVLRILGSGQDPQAAIDAARWHVTESFELAVELGFPPAAVEDLRRRGHRLLPPDAPAPLFGGAQVALRLKDGYAAASDRRKDGQAAGF